MIEIKHGAKSYSFSSNTACVKLKESIGSNECIGFYDSENNVIYDLHSQIQGPAVLEVLTSECLTSNELLRASLALILADCIDGVLVEINLIDSGFNCKFKMDSTVSENDFFAIKAKMLEKIDFDLLFEKNTKSYDESVEAKVKYHSDLAQEGPNIWYKFGVTEIISDLPVLFSSAECSKHFEIQKVAEEEFAGDKIQKITVAAFFKKKDLDLYFENLEKLKQFDHRLIGENLELFHMIPEAAGSVFWLPKGWRLFRDLEKIIREKSYEDYKEVRTPFVMSSSFWQKSGHLKAYGKNMMHIKMGDEAVEEAALKPMNCPGHIEIFKYKKRSYRDLPFRLAELGSCHRYEPSGSLHGLLRVRSFTMDDGHIFCSEEQIKDEVKKFMQPALNLYKYFGFDGITIKLATRPEGALGDIERWNYAEKMLQEALQESELPFAVASGEGAFYGPKIEIHVKDSMSRSWQLGTIQLDFVLPQRFGITYDDASGEKKVPCMLHRAMIGSLERFIAMLLEHNGGKLPLALAPVQLVVCSVDSDCNEFAKSIFKLLKQLGIKVELDTRNHTLSHKIREHRLAKVPMLAIIGKEEMKDNKMTLEYAGKKHMYKLDEIKNIMEHFSK